MVLLGVYYTSLDIDEVGAEGLMLTLKVMRKHLDTLCMNSQKLPKTIYIGKIHHLFYLFY